MGSVSPARLLRLLVGLLVFFIVAGVHFQTTRGAGSIPTLYVLWLFVPAPIVFLWRSRSANVSSNLRRTATTYLSVSAVTAIAILGAVGWVGAERGLHPSPCDSATELSFADFPEMESVAEPANFDSTDGTPLEGFFVPGAGPQTIVILNGYGSCYQGMFTRAEFLHDAGYSILLFNFRNQGNSGGDVTSTGFFERGDAIGAIRYLKTRDDVDTDHLGFFGASMGAAVAIMVAADAPEVTAIVAESPFSSLRTVVGESFEYFVDLPAFPFGPISVWIIEQRLNADADEVDPLGAVPRLSPRPLLIVHGEFDEVFSVGNAEAIFDVAGEPKELWVLPGGDHTPGMDFAPEEFPRRVTEFFDAHLR